MNWAEQYGIKSHSASLPVSRNNGFNEVIFHGLLQLEDKGGLSVDAYMFYGHIVASQMFHSLLGDSAMVQSKAWAPD